MYVNAIGLLFYKYFVVALVVKNKDLNDVFSTV